MLTVNQQTTPTLAVKKVHDSILFQERSINNSGNKNVFCKYSIPSSLKFGIVMERKVGTEVRIHIELEEKKIDGGMLTEDMLSNCVVQSNMHIYIDGMKRQRFIKRSYGPDELLNKIAVTHVKESLSVSRCSGPQIK